MRFWSRASGPWGSVFNRDDFTDREVQDTDGDGLPEFVDAWGQPLQFFRWPVLYHSDLQRGQMILPTRPRRTHGTCCRLIRLDSATVASTRRRCFRSGSATRWTRTSN